MTRLCIAISLTAFAFSQASFVASAQEAPTLGHTIDLAVNTLPTAGSKKLTVTTPAFKNGEEIPNENTQYGGNVFPGLAWTPGPAGTRTYAVIIQGKSQINANANTSIHLMLYNVPATVTKLAAGLKDELPPGAAYGPNVHGLHESYVGPHAHPGAKNGYHYQVLALDTVLHLDKDVSVEDLLAAMKGHVLASGEVIGLAEHDPNSPPPATGIPVPVRVESGMLLGVPGRDPAITVYKGVPYAAPPIGDLRFRAPEPPKAWQGVFKADHFGKSCPQGGPVPKENISEDCLTANIWTGANPSVDRRPVFVWIYGGGFSGGSGSDSTFDGEQLAKKGIIVVTFNYRLGALGFLATPELSKESGHNASGNYGLLDDIAMLQWVHKNITAFGGDPAKVTIGGQSAGAGSVGFLAMSPLAKGLFVRAITESHMRYSRDTELRYLSVSYRTEANAEAAGVKFAEQRGAHSLAELRALPWEKLLAGNEVDTAVETGSDAKPPLFRPVLDGWVIPKNYEQTYASGSQNDVAFLTGNNRDESGAVPENTFAKRREVQAPNRGGAPSVNVTLSQFHQYAERKFGPLAGEFFKIYPASDDDQAALQSDESVRDNSRISTYLWARDWAVHEKKPVYTYYWTHRPTGDTGGAHHASEILFVFDNLYLRNQAWTEEDRKVAETVSSYWVNFVATGNPNGKGLPVWPQFNSASATVMELGDHFGPIPVASPSALDFWERFFETQQAW